MATPKQTFFQKVKHWGGIVIASVLGGLDKVTKTVDNDAPEIEKLINEGASIASIVPGVGPQVQAGLTLGMELVGALNKTLDYTDEDFQKIVATAKEALPENSGLSVIVIAQSIEDEAKAWFASLEAQISAAKAAATAITGTSGAPAASK